MRGEAKPTPRHLSTTTRMKPLTIRTEVFCILPGLVVFGVWHGGGSGAVFAQCDDEIA